MVAQRFQDMLLGRLGELGAAPFKILDSDDVVLGRLEYRDGLRQKDDDIVGLHLFYGHRLSNIVLSADTS